MEKHLHLIVWLSYHSRSMSGERLDEADLEDQAYDRKWIADNVHLFAPLAHEASQSIGRGAVLVNLAELILRRHYEEGHPFSYHAPSESWLEADELADGDTRKRVTNLLAEYSPDKEFVLVLVKYNRCSIHRVSLPTTEEMDHEIRGAYVEAEAEERIGRLTCTDFWARRFRLTSPHTAEWLYRVA